MTEESKNTKLKIVIDIISGISFFTMLVVLPIYTHYDTTNTHSAAKWYLSLFDILLLANFIPCVFGSFWLIFRYGEIMAKKYPTIFNPRYSLILTFSLLLLYLTGYLIIKTIFWS
jgi:hypothetical protein